MDAARVRKATLVQHGHSPTEHLVYQTLWTLAGASGRDSFRDIRIGYTRLQSQSGITKRNLVQILRRLIEKLAIEVLEEEDSAKHEAKAYRVYGMAEILQRRQKAGLEWVIRHKGVDFVFPSGTSGWGESSPGDKLAPDDPPSSGDVSSSADAPPTGPVDVPSIEPVDAPSTHLGSILRKDVLGTSSLPPPRVVEAVRDAFGTADDDAIRRLVETCRSKTPDATDNEIAYFVTIQAERISRMAGIKNPIGLLITQVPRCFEGESFRQFREAERQSREAEAHRWAELRQMAHSTLDDPHSSEDERAWARSLLESGDL